MFVGFLGAVRNSIVIGQYKHDTMISVALGSTAVMEKLLVVATESSTGRECCCYCCYSRAA